LDKIILKNIHKNIIDGIKNYYCTRKTDQQSKEEDVSSLPLPFSYFKSDLFDPFPEISVLTDLGSLDTLRWD